MSLLTRLTTLATGIGFATVLAGGSAGANELSNPGFEAAGLGGGDVFGAADWTDFGGATFTVHTSILGGVGAHTGDHAFKMFGAAPSGIFQQTPINPGETANAGAWLLNFSGDQMANDQVAAVNIEWIQADGVTQSAITPFISNGTWTASSPVDTWTLQTVTGVAPADAAFARLTLITGAFGPGGVSGGAPFYDDAFLEVVPEPGSLALLSLGAIAVIRRRR